MHKIKECNQNCLNVKNLKKYDGSFSKLAKQDLGNRRAFESVSKLLENLINKIKGKL
jgi:hypothetical protein